MRSIAVLLILLHFLLLDSVSQYHESSQLIFVVFWIGNNYNLQGSFDYCHLEHFAPSFNWTKNGQAIWLYEANLFIMFIAVACISYFVNLTMGRRFKKKKEDFLKVLRRVKFHTVNCSLLHSWAKSKVRYLSDERNFLFQLSLLSSQEPRHFTYITRTNKQRSPQKYQMVHLEKSDGRNFCSKINMVTQSLKCDGKN